MVCGGSFYSMNERNLNVLGENMRKTHSEPTLFDVPEPIGKHPKNKEYKIISDLLDKHPEWAVKVTQCLRKASKSQSKRGRGDALTGEQVLRIAIVKFLEELDYRDLAHAIEDSALLSWFCRTNKMKMPKVFTTLQQVIAVVDEATLREINISLMQEAIQLKLESGQTVRVDTTVVETNIVHPSDARLIASSIEKLTKFMLDTRQTFVELRTELPFHNRIRAAKKAAFRIAMAKGKHAERNRKRHYKTLFGLLRDVREMAQAFVGALQEREKTLTDFDLQNAAVFLRQKLEHFLGLAQRVQDQAERRVLHGETVPANEKVLSLFETHTDVICRGKTDSPAEFGHKVFFSTGKSGLLLDYKVCQGNPGDDTLWPDAIANHKERYGSAPKEMTGDRRFYSQRNLDTAEQEGVEHVAVPKPGRQTQASLERMKRPWWKRLLRFRSGIEGILSWLLRSFGLHRCLWKGDAHFSAYVGWAVLGCNLTQIARKI